MFRCSHPTTTAHPKQDGPEFCTIVNNLFTKGIIQGEVRAYAACLFCRPGMMGGFWGAFGGALNSTTNGLSLA